SPPGNTNRAAARSAGTRIRTGWRNRDAALRRARDCRDQSRSSLRDRRWFVSQRSFLPAQRFSDRTAAVARTQRRYPDSRQLLCQPLRAESREEDRYDSKEIYRSVTGIFLAGKCPRTAKR